MGVIAIGIDEIHNNVVNVSIVNGKPTSSDAEVHCIFTGICN